MGVSSVIACDFVAPEGGPVRGASSAGGEPERTWTTRSLEDPIRDAGAGGDGAVGAAALGRPRRPPRRPPPLHRQAASPRQRLITRRRLRAGARRNTGP